MPSEESLPPGLSSLMGKAMQLLGQHFFNTGRVANEATINAKLQQSIQYAAPRDEVHQAYVAAKRNWQASLDYRATYHQFQQAGSKLGVKDSEAIIGYRYNVKPAVAVGNARGFTVTVNAPAYAVAAELEEMVAEALRGAGIGQDSIGFETTGTTYQLEVLSITTQVHDAATVSISWADLQAEREAAKQEEGRF